MAPHFVKEEMERWWWFEPGQKINNLLKRWIWQWGDQFLVEGFITRSEPCRLAGLEALLVVFEVSRAVVCWCSV
jgi:hypothetical protein